VTDVTNDHRICYVNISPFCALWFSFCELRRINFVGCCGKARLGRPQRAQVQGTNKNQLKPLQRIIRRRRSVRACGSSCVRRSCRCGASEGVACTASCSSSSTTRRWGCRTTGPASRGPPAARVSRVRPPTIAVRIWWCPGGTWRRVR
jgi:hypothetical protein